MGIKPIFFVAIAHTDNVACFTDEIGIGKERVSNINLFPERLRENLLFSMSFNPEIHYRTMFRKLDPIGDNRKLTTLARKPKRMFADCGAFQFRDMPIPTIKNTVLNYDVAWDYYQETHVMAKHDWDEIFLCSPDHIITSDMSDDDSASRFDFIEENAAPFLEKCKSDSRIYAVGVIHGRTIDERKKQYEMFKSLGYEYVAFGGMVPYSTKQNQVLDIVAGIKDIENPIIESESILGKMP